MVWFVWICLAGFRGDLRRGLPLILGRVYSLSLGVVCAVWGAVVFVGLAVEILVSARRLVGLVSLLRRVSWISARFNLFLLCAGISRRASSLF